MGPDMETGRCRRFEIFNGNPARHTINCTSEQRLDEDWWIDSSCSVGHQENVGA